MAVVSKLDPEPQPEFRLELTGAEAKALFFLLDTGTMYETRSSLGLGELVRELKKIGVTQEGVAPGKYFEYMAELA